MQLDDNEENVPLWDNISYAIATTAKKLIHLRRIKSSPSPLENIDDSLIEIFIENLKEMNCDLHYHVQDVKTPLRMLNRPRRKRALKRIGENRIVTVIKLEMIPDFNE